MRAHLAGCPACRDDYASLGEFVATEDRLRSR
jgi:predicted anti-sigma-YlaC factor YlaD